ncbi:MAG: hypothetical protein EBS95_06365 [Chitinophagia bacterium]|nr:hypothetical protein [Chitinophagia bacterium]
MVQIKIMQKKIIFCYAMAGLFLLGISACARKVGCPSNGKNVGAERLLSGEKLPKAKKFKS